METSVSRTGLNALNFFIAAVQAGFGPFVAVWLTKQGWSQTDVGVALSFGSGAALIGQLPGGWLVDAVHRKRTVMTVALAAIAGAALLLAFLPMRWPVAAAEAMDAFAACVITPSIAAITLRLCGHAAYSQRLGVNARYASLGAAGSSALLGLCAWYLSERAVFIMTAALVLPALAALHSIRAEDEADDETHPALLHPRERRRRAVRRWADRPRAGAARVRRLRRAVLSVQRSDVAAGAERVGKTCAGHWAGDIRRRRRAADDCRRGFALGGKAGADTWPPPGAAGRICRPPDPRPAVRSAALGRSGGAAARCDPDLGRCQRHGVRSDVAADRRRRHADAAAISTWRSARWDWRWAWERRPAQAWPVWWRTGSVRRWRLSGSQPLGRSRG